MNLEETAAKHLQQGNSYIEFEEYQSAISEFINVIILIPNHSIAHLELGKLYYACQNDFPKAKMHLLTSIEIDSSLVDAHMYLGIILNRMGDKIEVEYHFRQSILLSEGDAITLATFAEEFLWHNSRYGEAEENFRMALKNDPECVLAIRDYARMLACHGRDNEANDLFNKALAIDPDDFITKKEIEKFLKERNDPDRSPLECLQKAVKNDPNYSEGIKRLKILLNSFPT